MQSYKELLVWQASVELVAEVYRLTRFFPGKRYTDLPASFGVPLSPCQATLPRARGGRRGESLSSFSAIRGDRYLSSRRNYALLQN